MNTKRPDITTYMMNLARMAATRATCPKRQVGAVLAAERRVVSMGYNGAPPGLTHCFGKGCENAEGTCINTIHAEVNALLHASRICDTLYCTDTPCASCLKAALAHNPDICVYFWRWHYDLDCKQFVELHELQGRFIQIDRQASALMLDFLPPIGGERLP